MGYRLAAFGSRQVLYERFFFGDPVRMAGALFNTYDRTPYMARVQALVEASLAGADDQVPPAQRWATVDERRGG